MWESVCAVFRKKTWAVVCALPLSFVAHESQANAADDWELHQPDGAMCGNGEAYDFFIRPGRSDKIALELRGGGACWSESTCLGAVPLALMGPGGIDRRKGLTSRNPEKSPLADATYISLPYCTGDIHIGRHIANYGGREVAHMGGRNFELVLDYLNDELDLFADVAEVVLVGQSAGALGVLMNMPIMDRYIDSEVQRTAIVDSPGLHFGDTFWDKFPDAWLADLDAAMNGVGVGIDLSTGMVAEQMPQLCGSLPHWNIGFLQATRDVVMSIVFGNTTATRHRRNVMSDLGLAGLGRLPAGTCSVWLAESMGHTFTGLSVNEMTKTRGVSGFEFARRLVAGETHLSILP